ncbi:uncharacterized protein LOC106648272 [Trichogramma pretiosum]|uniref:uncharacterized protein LOC106648272 n=1 Tax=Trichogramma pretiosum TaxID=7493 RepID=UPI0006C98A4D|nr:uncharacterized protein LOC106648272 [Trichogramma pretiosum]
MKRTAPHRTVNMHRLFNDSALLCRVFLLTLLLISEVISISITKVDIPYVVRAGSPDPVVLDCNYDLGNSKTQGLVIKWFVNQDVLYQWIHGKNPAGSDEFQKYIDASYRASNDTRSEYRAVKLVRPGHELSGNIKCIISTIFDEVEAVRKMLVYSPEKVLRIHQPMMNETTNRLIVSCSAEDLFPKPRIIIYWNRKPIKYQEQRYKNKTDGRYSAEAVGVLEADKVKLPALFRCEVSIPEANYTSFQEYVYNGSNVPQFSLLILAMNFLAFKKY